MRSHILLILLILLCHSANAQTAAWDRANSIEKGFNLAGWLEAGWWGDDYPQPYTYTKDDLSYLQSIGFKTVRMPMLFEWHSDLEEPYELHSDHLAYAWIDSVITWTQDLGMNLIIVNHHGMELTDANYIDETPRLVGLWQNIVESYDYLDPDKVFFELRNEPDLNISNDNFAYVANAVIEAIREINTTHSLIVGANWWNAGWSLATTEPYADDNIIYTFHTYDPYDFTHQGFSWTEVPAGMLWPNVNSDEDDLAEALQEVKDWSNEHQVPVFLGEFGVSTVANLQSRCNWIEAMVSNLTQLELPWIYWDVKHFGDSFGIFEDNQLDNEHIISCFEEAMGLGMVSVIETPNLTVDVYPNPATEALMISSSSQITGITICDMSGREMLVEKIERHEVKLPLHLLNSGFYLIRITLHDNVEITQRLSIVK